MQIDARPDEDAARGIDMLDDGADQLVLAREMIGNDARADAGALGDLRQRGLAETEFGNGLDRAFDDLSLPRASMKLGLF
ncbi:MAG: hypothetical protein WDN69_18370 [Aliidongia sp.]